MAVNSHAQQRGMERYGTLPTKEDLRDMEKQVKDQRAFFLFRQNRTTTIWLAHWPGLNRIVPVVYRHKRIKTILPQNIWGYFERKLKKTESNHDL